MLEPNPYTMNPKLFSNWEIPSQENCEMIAMQFAEQLFKRYGLAILCEIDKANKSLTLQNDAVYDFIDATEFFQEFVKACDALGVNHHNPHYSKCFHLLREDGYEIWGDCYD